jgi:hypothetical protein
MFATRRSRIALGCVVLLGVFAYCERESLAPLACIGDHACAAARARALGDAKMPERSLGLADKAYDLGEALERDECEDAAGPAGSIRSIEKQVRDPSLAGLVSRALLAYEVYCFVPLPETRSSCAGSLGCALDRTDILVARVEASRGDRNLSRSVRALRASLSENDCPAVADVARALRRRSLATIVPPKIALALERSLDATASYCRDKPEPNLPAPPVDATVSLARTACSGSCPQYSVIVRADGRVTRVGDLGDDEHTIAKDRVRILFDSFARLHFADKNPSYPRLEGDDGPGYELTLNRDDIAFTATAGSACRLDDPAVCYLALEVDELAETPGR